MKRAADKMIFRSGNLEINPPLGQIRVAGNIIRLTPVNMKVLVLLLENNNQVVSRQNFFNQVWRNQIVSDDSLTRCISDIRTQLALHTDQAVLIETIPKHGYRWVPAVRKTDTTEPGNNSVAQRNSFAHFYQKGLLGLTVLLLFSLLMIWYASQPVHTESINLAMLPISSDQPARINLAQDLEDMLQQQLLKNNDFSVLSPIAFAGNQDNPYPYLAREFGTQWIIEGRVREYEGKFRISLRLVEALSATVIFSETGDISHTAEELERFCAAFVTGILIHSKLEK